MPKSADSFFKNKWAIVSVTPILVYSVFCILGFVQFKLWRQVVHIWKLDLTFADTLVAPYGLRFLLVSPLFKLSEWMGISYNWLFSITFPFLIYLITHFSSRSIQRLYRQIAPQYAAIIFVGISLCFISLSLFMNGRLIFAFTGSSILMWSLLNWDNNRDTINLLAVLAAILLSLVSRGTFLVTIASIYFFLAVNIAIANPLVSRRKILLTYSILLVAVMPYLITVVMRLLEHFGGGIEAIGYMLSHGYGSTILRPHFIILLVSIFVLLSLGYVYRKILYRYWILASLIFFPLVGGMFGISTALAILPPLLVAVSLATLEFAAWVERRNLETVVKQE